MINFMIGGLFIALMFQIYRSMHGKGGAKGTGAAGKGADKEGSGTGSKGGFGDIFGMGKSNVQVYGTDKKIKTRFKHVAGMDNAK